MKPRDRAAEKSRRHGSKASGTAKSAAKGIAATKKVAPAKKPPVKIVAKKPVPVVKPVAQKPVVVTTPPKPVPLAAAAVAAPARPIVARAVAPARPVSAEAVARVANAQQVEERRKAVTRKLFARLRSLEAIVGADLRKRGSLMLSQAVDQWYAEAISATANDVSITNAARAVISQL
jgi:hypothetical protein